MGHARILIVEEQRLFAKDLQRRLQDLHYDVVAMVSTGEDALRLAQESLPDLILMAVELEGDLDGIKAAETIQSRVDIPVVYVTGYPSETILERTRSARPHSFLRRPFSTRQLATTVEIALDHDRIEKQLRESEKRYRAVVEDQTELICRFLPEGNLTFVNDAHARYFGRTRGDLIGRAFLALIPEDQRSMTAALLAGLTEDQPTCTFEHRLDDSAGEPHFLQWTGRAIFGDQRQLVEYQAVGRDVTEQRRAKMLLLQDERKSAIGELAYGVAHNFNNLLQIVLGNAETALGYLEEARYEEVSASLEQIRECSRAGGELVRRLQQFARRSTGTVGHDGTVFDLSDTIDQAIELTRPWWETNPEKVGPAITVKRNIQPGCLVRGQENELSEAVVNLVKNAAEAISGTGHIEVACFVQGDRVVLQVRDDGCGIREEHLDRIFQPFWTTKGFRSPGMGLAGTYGIVSRHQGTISVESREGEGSTFTVEIPLALPPAEAPTRTEQDTPAGGLTMLVIDDMEPVVMTLKEALRQFGHEVFTALSGREGLELFQRQPFDVVICDLGMPGMSGWEVGRAILELCRERGMPKTPFVFATGWGARLDDEERIAESGVDAVVAKPVNIPELLKIIGRLTASSQSAREARH